jgi:hypothetical protein
LIKTDIPFAEINQFRVRGDSLENPLADVYVGKGIGQDFTV